MHRLRIAKFYYGEQVYLSGEDCFDEADAEAETEVEGEDA